MAQDGELLQAALQYAERGKPVFPCRADKSPLTAHGFKDATVDPEQIRAWWRAHPEALIGMPTGAMSGLVVLDIDVKSGKDGNDSLWQLQEAHNTLPPTIEALTPSGGRHLYFRHPGRPVKSTAEQLGPGLDTRGDGGYVIVPPSGVNGHRYEWEASNPPAAAELPAWLLEQLGEEARPMPEEAQDGAIAAGQRNAYLTSLAGAARRRGASQEALQALLHAENDARCWPPLPRAEVDRIAASVGRYGPAQDFTAEAEPAEQGPPSPVGYQALFLERPPAPQVLWPGLVPCDAFGLVGPGGVAKSTLVLWLMVHTILGRGALGRVPVRSGACLYVSAEDDLDTLRYRVREVCDALGLSEDERHQVAEQLYLEDYTGRVGRLIEADERGNLQVTGFADYLISRYADRGIVLATFDPAVYFGPGERYVNDAEAALMLVARRVSRGLHKAAVGYVHHTGKLVAREGISDQYAGRGGSAFADNSRGLLVLHSHEADSEQYPRPPGVTDEDIEDGRAMRLHVGKFSAGARERQPIWIVRGADNPWRFDVHQAPDDETRRAEARRRADEQREEDLWALARFLHAEAGRQPPVRHSRNSLEEQRETFKLPRGRLRAAIHRGLQTSILTEEEPVAEARKQGRRAVLSVHPAVTGKLDKEAA